MLDKKLELALLRKSMSGSVGPCSPELLSCGHRAVRPDRQASGSAVDGTLSDHGSPENAHTPAMGMRREALMPYRSHRTGSSVRRRPAVGGHGNSQRSASKDFDSGWETPGGPAQPVEPQVAFSDSPRITSHRGLVQSLRAEGVPTSAPAIISPRMSKPSVQTTYFDGIIGLAIPTGVGDIMSRSQDSVGYARPKSINVAPSASDALVSTLALVATANRELGAAPRGDQPSELGERVAMFPTPKGIVQRLA